MHVRSNNATEYHCFVLTIIMPEFLRAKTFRLKEKETADIFLTERV